MLAVESDGSEHFKLFAESKGQELSAQSACVTSVSVLTKKYPLMKVTSKGFFFIILSRNE